MSEDKVTQQNPKAILHYHKPGSGYGIIGTMDAELLDELAQVLSNTVDVERKERYFPYDEVRGSTGIEITFLEIILVFASTTIATSILSKLGEDIYNQAKSKIREAIKDAREKKRLSLNIIEHNQRIIKKKRHPFFDTEDREQITLKIKIKVEETTIEAIAPGFNSHKTLIEAICNLKQMVTDVQGKREIISEQMSQTSRPIRTPEEISKSSKKSRAPQWFKYRYDHSKKRWKLISSSLDKLDEK